MIKPENLKKILETWDSNQSAGLEAEWNEIIQLSDQFTEENGYKKCGNEVENKKKNRYPDVLPYNHSRVKLITGENDKSEEYEMDEADSYINASFIPVCWS